MQDGKRIVVVEPDCPPQVIRVAAGVDATKLAATAGKNILIFVAGLKFAPKLDLRPNDVDNLLHVVDFEPKDDDLRMLEGVKKTCRVGPLWSRRPSLRKTLVTFHP